MNVLVCNAGSSSLKFSLIESSSERLLAEGSIDWATQPTRLIVHRPGQPELRQELSLGRHSEAIGHILRTLTTEPEGPLHSIAEIHAVGHRVVHGGDRYTRSVRITDEVKRAIAELAELAPLHNPAALEGIQAAEEALPQAPQVAVFDTAFHATLSEAARTYPVPHAWTTEWGIRRYGFHGLSHAYCARRAAEMLGRDDARLIVCHIGNGASVSAIRSGKCVDTSMGFTPLEGLMMGTRSGSVDPGAILHLLRHRGLSAEQMDHALNQESGLLGVSGISSDLRLVQQQEATNPQARLALEIYVHRLRKTIGAMAACLDGCDALVFTAGVGEHSALIRGRTCAGLGFLGLTIDEAANQAARPDIDIAAGSAPVRALVIATREDLTVAREARAALSR